MEVIASPARLLRALEVVRDAGPRLNPTWDTQAREGVTYRGSGSALDDAALDGDLERLWHQDYVERIFVDRLSLCPRCGSHALNVHEACLSCFSSNLTHRTALLHFRCGFVGPADAFAEETEGRRCPKCRKLLQDVGTDHDSPGEYFTCRACNAEFQEPEIGARCVSCGATFAGTEMHAVRQRDVFAYRLTPRGNAALAESRLLDAPDEVLTDTHDAVYRRHVIVAHVEDERRRHLRTGTPFGLIVVAVGTNGVASAPDDSAVAAVHSALGPGDKLGTLDGRRLVALLPSASRGASRATLKRLVTVGAEMPPPAWLRAELVEVPNGGDVAECLDDAARRLCPDA